MFDIHVGRTVAAPNDVPVVSRSIAYYYRHIAWACLPICRSFISSTPEKDKGVRIVLHINTAACCRMVDRD